jgi:hypothetical protein
MTLQERDAFTTRWLMALKTSQADGDGKNARISASMISYSPTGAVFPATATRSTRRTAKASGSFNVWKACSQTRKRAE